MVNIFIALEVEGRCPGALGGTILLLHHCRLLAVQNGAGSVSGIHVQNWAVLVLADYVHDAAECGPGILVHGGLHIGGGRFSLRFLLHDYHYTFALGHGPIVL